MGRPKKEDEQNFTVSRSWPILKARMKARMKQSSVGGTFRALDAAGAALRAGPTLFREAGHIPNYVVVEMRATGDKHPAGCFRVVRTPRKLPVAWDTEWTYVAEPQLSSA